jgi:hypothetical protein
VNSCICANEHDSTVFIGFDDGTRGINECCIEFSQPRGGRVTWLAIAVASHCDGFDDRAETEVDR